MTTLYVSPTGSGKRDGSSAENAANIWSLDKMILKAGAGGTVLLAADKGSYDMSYFVSITHGGDAGNPVTIKGVDSSGNPMNVQFTGTRSPDYSPTGAVGNELFRLLGGADHLVFENMSFKNVRNAFRVGDDISGLTISNMSADNVQRFFEDYAATASKSATISGLTIENVEIDGYSKGAIRLQYDTHDVVIRDVRGDSERQDGDNFAIGIHFGGTVHDVLVKDTSMLNSTDTLHTYWNGDGFAAEKDVYNLRFEDTYAAGNTDAGYDLKSQNTVLVRAISEDNNRNYRVWGDGVTIIDSMSIDPEHRGGTASQAHVHLAPNSHLTIINSTLIDDSAKTIAIDLSEENAHVTLVDTDILINEKARLLKLSKGSGATNADGSALRAQTYDEALATALHASLGLDYVDSNPTSVTVKPTPPVPLPPSYSISPGTAQVTEGNIGDTTVTFTVSRTGDISGAGKVDYTVNGIGDNPANSADFEGGVLPSGEVDFAAGETSKTFTVAIRGDKLVETNETFQVTLGSVAKGVIANGAADVLIANDDVKPIFTVLDKQHSVDLSLSLSETASGSSAHNSYYIDVAARTGKDVITAFGHDDVLLLTKAFYDSNNDGIINAGSNFTFAVDGPGSADTLTLRNGVDSLRLIGKTDAGLYVYGDTDVRPTGAVESHIGDETLSGTGNAKKPTTFFFDNALDIDLGDDTVTKFGANDLLVTTSPIEAVNGKIAVDETGGYALPGGAGDVNDSYYAGEGGHVAIYDTAGKAIASLEFDGVMQHNSVNYYVYSQIGSAAGVSELRF
ncbi:Calx-beta domain-containing protein [Methylosinus sp. PW1]|uniref:Calx-beta domain-containing protein n=1 Tax=Methylosinus sp. PW1 TaxID=107636 RepID=UPI0005622B57|nr:Calx-beta domain-containing protein [Methylosinus sp. PW1]